MRTLTSMRRMKRTKAGARCRSRFTAGLLGIHGICACLLTVFPGGLASAVEKRAEPYALIVGTVFRESGLSLPGAEVTVSPLPDAQGKRGSRKAKRVRAVSDARGEFAIRVPAGPLRYTVSVKASGHLAQEKEVSIQGDERVDLFFRLEPAPE